MQIINKQKKMNISIRKADLQDIEKINKAAQIVFPNTYLSIIGKEQTEYMLDKMYSLQSLEKQISEGHDFYLAENNDNKICGFISCFPSQNGIYRIEKLYVMPECQKQGLGKILFNHAKKLALELKPKVNKIQLNVNRENPALEFYKHQGMYIAEQGDYPFGGGFFMCDYIMEYEI